MMSRLDPLNDVFHRLGRLLPSGTTELRDDVRKNVRAVVGAALARMELVTREEYDVQAALLARTRARLEALERQVAALEAELSQQRPEGPGAS